MTEDTRMWVPPEPAFPSPPPRRPRRARTILVAVVSAIMAAVLTMFLLPAVLGANPIDVLTNKQNATTSQSTETASVAERVVQGGSEAVVDAAAKILPSVVNIQVQIGRAQQAIGSGFIYRSDGYIATNDHVVEGATAIKVSLKDGSTYDGKVVGTNPGSDLAMVKIDASNLPAVTLGTSGDLAVGEMAIACGSPEGFTGSVTSGIVSALNRNLDTSGQGAALTNVIQTDAPINPGNSGGPLVNSLGDVIGINTAIISQSGGNEGIGFAIPIDTAKPILNKFITKVG